MKLLSIRFWMPLLTITIILLVMLIVFCNVRINKTADHYIYNDTANCPRFKIGVLLGTSKYISNGKPNQFFINRIEAAVKLYKAGKIKYIIVSGDNSSLNYNEPIRMKRELVKRGIPPEVIFVDYAGFRTLDSVVRAKLIFGQNTFYIISQEFHNERAIFIARKHGIYAYGFNAEDVKTYYGYFTRVREVFARVKVFIDIYILHIKPRYLGDKIDIG